MLPRPGTKAPCGPRADAPVRDGTGGRLQALLAVPGDLATPTGGYAYARRLIEAAPRAGLALYHWPLPELAPIPSAEALSETERRLSVVPPGWPVIVDGLALGVMPVALIRSVTAPVIALCHHPLGLESGLPPELAARLIESERAALAAAAFVITTSRTTAGTLTEVLSVPPERIAVAPPGTDPVAPAPRPVADGPCRLLSVGSLTPRKGHDVLIEALAGLSDLDWRLTLVGPEDRDPAHAARVFAAVEAHGLGTRVIRRGAATSDALATAYAEADLFVLAARYEGYGMAFTEAMAHGLPVIGCAAGAVAEATRGAAVLVAPDDPAALRAALRRPIESVEARRELAARSRAAAAAFPRWDDTARAVNAALRAVLAGPETAG